MKVCLKHISEVPIHGAYGSILGWQEVENVIDGVVAHVDGRVIITSPTGNVLANISHDLYGLLHRSHLIQIKELMDTQPEKA